MELTKHQTEILELVPTEGTITTLEVAKHRRSGVKNIRAAHVHLKALCRAKLIERLGAPQSYGYEWRRVCD